MPKVRRFILSFVIALCAVGIARCGSGTTALLSPSPSAGRCGIALKAGNTQIAAGGGSGSISVDVERECQWTIKAGASWLTFGSTTSGQGPAEVSYTVQPNRSTSARSQEVSVSDQKVVISQDGAVCAFEVGPDSFSFVAAGGIGHATIKTEDFCSWSVSTQTTWLTIEGAASRTGSGEVEIRGAANTATQARTGSIAIAGKQVAVSQAAAVVVSQNPPTPPTTCRGSRPVRS